MEDAFGQMQCCSTDSAKLSVKFTVKLFLVISIMESVMHMKKNRIGFAIDCKSSGFSI